MVCGEGLYREGAKMTRLEGERRSSWDPSSGPSRAPTSWRQPERLATRTLMFSAPRAFNDEAHASEFDKLGRIPVLKARGRLPPYGGGREEHWKGNLFVIFGEPDIELLTGDGDKSRCVSTGSTSSTEYW